MYRFQDDHEMKERVLLSLIPRMYKHSAFRRRTNLLCQGRMDSPRVPAVCHVIMLRLPGVCKLGKGLKRWCHSTGKSHWYALMAMFWINENPGLKATILCFRTCRKHDWTCSRHVATRPRPRPSIPQQGLAVPAARRSEEMSGKRQDERWKLQVVGRRPERTLSAHPPNPTSQLNTIDSLTRLKLCEISVNPYTVDPTCCKHMQAPYEGDVPAPKTTVQIRPSHAAKTMQVEDWQIPAPKLLKNAGNTMQTTPSRAGNTWISTNEQQKQQGRWNANA